MCSSRATEQKKPQGNSFRSRKSTHQVAEETMVSEEGDTEALNNIHMVSSAAQ